MIARQGLNQGQRCRCRLIPFKALVAPRPIGWISTLSPDGHVNLAPYSYFQAVADSPDIVMFSATPRTGNPVAALKGWASARGENIPN